MNKTSDGLLAGILGAALFLVFLFVINAGPIVSLVIGGAGFGAGMLLFSRKKPEVIAQEIDLKTAVSNGQKKLVEIQKFQKLIKKPVVVAKVKEICEVIEKILEDLEKDPQDLKAARQFLDYYLDSTIKILNRYVELSAQNISDDSIKASLLKVENMLQTIKDAFEKKLAQLLSNDVMDLDTELSLLDQSINMDGLRK